MTIWNKDHVEQIRRLLGEGKTYSKIAHILHSTRNAIIGLAHRHKLKSLVRPSVRMNTKISEIPNKIAYVKKFNKHRVVKDDEPRGLPHPVREGLCKWIMEEEATINSTQCGWPVVKGTSWCSAHHAIVFTTINGQKK